ncbi:MAG: hypothetical protein SGJ17_12800 [Hyphomicrobiales bacterium]|nr:hypothetical protein [Hyphomicrobiales bacterium]
MKRYEAGAIQTYVIYRDPEPGEGEFVAAFSELCEAYCKARGFESEMRGTCCCVSLPACGTHAILIHWASGADLQYWVDLMHEARDALRDEFKIYMHIIHTADDDARGEKPTRCPRDFRRWLTNVKGKSVLRDILKRRPRCSSRPARP